MIETIFRLVVFLCGIGVGILVNPMVGRRLKKLLEHRQR